MNIHIKHILFFISIFSLIGCSTESDDGDVGEQMLIEVNKLRTHGCKCGEENIPKVKELQRNASLERAAFLFAKDMHDYKYFSHIGRDSSNVLQRSLLQGYDGSTVLENIARGYNTIRDVIEAWKLSEAHCKAIMDSSMDVMGGANYGDYWVIDFGNSQ